MTPKHVLHPNIGTLGGMIEAREESKGHRSGHGTKGMPSGMGGSSYGYATNDIHQVVPIQAYTYATSDV